MNPLGGLGTGEVVALGWTLLHFCWESAAIALVYAVVDRCAQRAGATVRYGIAVAALGLMALAAVGTFVDQERLVVPVAASQLTEHDGERAVSQLGVLHAAVEGVLPAAAPAMGDGELWIAGHADRLMPWIDGIWLGGVLLLSLKAAGGWWQLQGVRHRAQALVPQETRRSFDRLAAQFAMTRGVALQVSEEMISPMVMGLWHVTVLMPLSAAMQLEPEQLEAVLAHELAHVRRWDYLCNLIQTAVECLFFFHPAVWWVSGRVREFREVCCDEVAAQVCADPAVYAEALLRLEEQRAKHVRLAMALHGDGGSLLNRIRRVMGETTMEKRAGNGETMSGVRIVAAGVLLTCLYGVPHLAHGAKRSAARGTAGSDWGQTAPAPMPAAAVAAAPAVVAAPAPTRGADAWAAAAPQAVTITSNPQVNVAPQTMTMTLAEPVVSVNVAPAVTIASGWQQGAGAGAGEGAGAGSGAGAGQPRISGTAFIDGMRAAGYTLDLDKDLNVLVSLRSVGVTPEYAKAMAGAGFGKPTLHELVSLKSVGVTPEYLTGMKAAGLGPESLRDAVSMKSVGVTPEYAKSVAALGMGTPDARELVSIKSVGVTPEYLAELKAAGVAPANLRDAVSMKSVGVTPEYAKAMASTGLGTPTMRDLISMKSVGVTPEYLVAMKAAGLGPESLHEAVSMKSVGVTPEYAKAMAGAGFKGLSTRDLISMKSQGVSPDSVKWVKATFPDADMRTIEQAAAFHIDAAFAASAKAHGFNATSLDKLVKLKMSGLLD
jgi:beta-lactamase regulating signal transducer with metallopeptidase domain